MSSFTSLDSGSDADWDAVRAWKLQHPRDAAAPALAYLASLQNAPTEGLPINVYRHSLQTATRILRDGGDDELVTVGLLHDIGDFIAERNHGEVAATILRPYINEANHWLLVHHAMFQGYHFWHQFGMDRDARERFRGHPHFEYAAHICDQYDQRAFDPGYDELPLRDFEPIVRRVFARTPTWGDEVVL